MRTLHFKVIPDALDVRAILECANILRRGGLVAFPTETVYGLGAHARNARAVRGIFEAKGRPADNPLIVHTADEDEAFSMAASVPLVARTLAARFWPGPLTMVLRRGPGLPDVTTAGLDTVAVRVPSHPVALALLGAFEGPVAAPSANVSGRPSPTRAEHVLADLFGKIDAVLDGGEAGVGLESTVVDVTTEPPRVLRLGGLSLEALHTVDPSIRYDAGNDHGERDAGGQEPGPVRAPGMKYRHYAPEAPLVVITGDVEDVRRALGALREKGRSGKARPAFLVSEETAVAVGFREGEPGVFILGRRSHPDEAARQFYHALRTLDRYIPTTIYAEEFEHHGLGMALQDRLWRAAQGSVQRAQDVCVSLGACER